MKAGEIYDIYFPYKPPSKGGKERPALIISVDGGLTLAVTVKITESAPTEYFPNRIPIYNWRKSGLDKFSHAEIDSIQIINSDIKSELKRGVMHPVDFNNILKAFYKLHKIKGH